MRKFSFFFHTVERREKILIALIPLIAIGTFLIGRYTTRLGIQTQDTLREISSQYKFINPLLLCDSVENTQTVELTPLKNKVRSLLANTQNQQTTSLAAVYFRDLNSGQWFGINEDVQFAPASLLKVPLMIAAYRYAQQEPGFLKQRVTYDAGVPDENAAEYFKPLYTIKPGQTYSIEELIQYMIGYSDNNARTLLHTYIPIDILKETYSDLGLHVPSTTDTVDFMSAKQYSHFFRVLYNGSYLSRTQSEKALEYLADVDFPEGLIAGVPKGFIVADKFGEREIVDAATGQSSEHELHDCGIVYYPSHPYLLCVMTKGNNFDGQANTIRDISNAVYSEVQKEYH